MTADLNYTQCLDLPDPMVSLRRAIKYQLPKRTIFDFLDLTGSNFSLKGIVIFPKNNDNETGNWNDTDEKLPLSFRYWEGPFHYSLFALAGFMICLLLLTFFMFYIRVFGIKYPCPTMVVYKAAMFIIALLIFFLSIVLVAGQFFLGSCLTEITTILEDQAYFYFNNLAYYVKETVIGAFVYVDILYQKFEYLKETEMGQVLGMDATEQPPPQLFLFRAPADIKITPPPIPLPPTTKLVSTTISTTTTTKNPLAGALNVVMDKVNQGADLAKSLKDTLKSIHSKITNFAATLSDYMTNYVLGPLKHFRSYANLILTPLLKIMNVLKEVILGITIFKYVNYIIPVISLLLAMCMLCSVKSKDCTRMKWLCRLSYIMMVAFWLLAMMYLPLSIYLGDLCNKPEEYLSYLIVETIKGIDPTFEIPNIDVRELISHYMTCEGVNPLAVLAGPLIQAIGTFGRHAMLLVNELGKSGGDKQSDDAKKGESALKALGQLQTFLYELVIFGCDDVVRVFNRAIKSMCNQGLLGMLLTAIFSPCLGILYMIYLLFCMRIKHFVMGKPKKETKLQRIQRKQKEKMRKYLINMRKRQLQRAKRLQREHERDTARTKKMAVREQEKKEHDLKKKEFDRIKMLQEKRLRQVNKSDNKTHRHLQKALMELPICMCPPPELAAGEKPRYVLKVKCPDECKMIDFSSLEQVRNLNKLYSLKPPALREKEDEAELAEDMARPPCKVECKGKRIRSPCLGLDRLRTFMKMGLPIYGEKAKRPDEPQKMTLDIAAAEGCPGVQCPMAMEAFEKLEAAEEMARREPDVAAHKTIRLSCGCKFPTLKIKQLWGLDS